jgi:long-chain acyl-CoA synthetase
MSRIGLIGENSIEYIDKLLDIWNIGDCAVLIDWRIPPITAIIMLKEASVDECFIDKNIFRKFPADLDFNGITFIPFEKNDNAAILLPEFIFSKFRPNYSRSEAVVLYSSGTTGNVKGIILSHYAINTNSDSIIDYMRPNEIDCIYIAKTISHSSTVTGELLASLKSKIKLVVAPTIVPPRFALKNMAQMNVTIICLNPTLLDLYAEEYARGIYNLPFLRTIYVSGSILNDKIYKFAHDSFKNIPIYNVYGLSEAGPRVTAQTSDCCKNNSVGRPIKGIKIKILDDNGNEVVSGNKGIIYINTPSRFDGYITGNNKMKSLYKEWLNSGDIGYIDEENELHIVDRIDDVIIIDSQKVYPNEVEKQLLTVNEILDCIVIKVDLNNTSNPILACLYCGEEIDDVNIKYKMRDILAHHEIPKVFIKQKQLIRTQNGKLDRRSIKKQFIEEYKNSFILKNIDYREEIGYE